MTTAVTASMNKNLTAYTIGFNDKKFNESDYAAQVADSLGVKFVSNKCEGDDMLREFQGIAQYFDEPFADFSLIPTSLLAEKSRGSVTVALGGDGADEFFLGYYDHYADVMKRERLFHFVPSQARKAAFSLIKHHPAGYHFNYIHYDTVMDSYLSDGHYGHFYGAEKYDILELANRYPDRKYLNKERGLMSFSDNDIKHYMNSCINTKADRATMRSSLELRSPLMDYRLAEYSRLLPVEYLVNKEYGGKRILKGILYEMVPKAILDRPKMGFSPPVAQWFHNELRGWLMDNLREEYLKEIIPELDSHKIMKLRDDFLRGKRISGLTFFKLYMYIEWYKNYSISKVA